MPGNGFNASYTTLFDYLRIIFQRWFWILFIVILSIVVARFYLWKEPKYYKSQMFLLVYKQDPNSPLVRQLVGAEPLNRMINIIRDRLQVEKRLKHLAANLRFEVKNMLWREKQAAALRANQPVYTPTTDNLHEQFLVAFSPTMTINTGPDSMLLNNRAADWLSNYISLAELKHEKITLNRLAAEMGMQSLARIFGVDDRAAEAEPGDHMIVNMAKNTRYVKALGEILQRDYKDHPVNGASTPKAIRDLAIRLLQERLKKEFSRQGGGEFSETAHEEISKELNAIERLVNLRLYTAANEFFAKEPSGYWVGRLRSGLVVSGLSHNRISIAFSTKLYERKAPYRQPGNLINDVVLRTTEKVLRAEFSKMSTSRFRDSEDALSSRQSDLERDLHKLDNEIYNIERFKNIDLKRALDKDTPRSEQLSKHWDEQFLGQTGYVVHIRRMNESIDELRDIQKEISGITGRISKLNESIQNPALAPDEPDNSGAEEQTTDSAEVRALRVKLAALLRKRNSLLQNKTRKHPFVVKINREIASLQAEVTRLGNQRRPQKTVRIKPKITTDPKLQKYIDQRDDLLVTLEGLREQQKNVDQFIGDEKKKAQNAIANQNEYEAKIQRRTWLKTQLSRLSTESRRMTVNEKLGERFKPIFETHTKPGRPALANYYKPQDMMVSAIAVLIGVLVAASVVFFLEYTDHSMKTSEDVKRFLGLPVLGTIPEFRFSVHESVERRGRFRFLSKMRRSRGAYPKPIDEKEPLPVRDRMRTVQMRQRWLWMLGMILTFLVVASAASYLGYQAWQTWAKKSTAETEVTEPLPTKRETPKPTAITPKTEAPKTKQATSTPAQ